MAAHWIPIVGNAEVSEGTITYIPSVTKDGPNAGRAAAAVLRSNIEFESGELSFEAYLNDPGSTCQVGVNMEGQSDPVLFAGLNVGRAAYGFASIQRDGDWNLLENAGWGNPVTIGEWLAVKLRVVGSRVDLFVNEVRVCSTLQNLSKGPIELFLRGEKAITVRNVEIAESKPQAFVVMQFTDAFDALYRDVIKPTCEKFGLTAVRADDIHKSGLIIDDIARSIEEASVIIADLTVDNPNVFYEVGYAHAIKKATILLSDRTRDKLPFDVSGFRTIFYDNTIGGKSDVEARLTAHLENIAA